MELFVVAMKDREINRRQESASMKNKIELRNRLEKQASVRSKLIPGVVVLALSLGTMLIVSTGCGPKAGQQKPPPPSVTVAPVERKQIVEWDEFTGRIEPVESVEVRPRVSGYIQEVRFQSGQLVKKGEVLFVIDPRWHQATFDQQPC